MPTRAKLTRIDRDRTPLVRRVDDLERERARLEEEIRQLRAAVHIWSEVFRQTTAGPRNAPPIALEIP